MLYMIAKTRRDCLPCFVTLTYPKVYNMDERSWKNDLIRLSHRLSYEFDNIAVIWKLEPQRRGAPHYHLLVWNESLQDLQDRIPVIWNQIVAPNDVEHLRWHRGKIGNVHCVQEVRTQMRMLQYVTKYISKSSLEGWKNVGKWWGVFFKDRLPFGQEVVYEIDDEVANDLIRYIRRFTGFGGGLALQSRQTVCDADQWMEKLQTKPMGSYLDWLRSVEGGSNEV